MPFDDDEHPASFLKREHILAYINRYADEVDIRQFVKVWRY